MPELLIPKNIFQMFGYLPNFFIVVSLWNTLLIQSIDQLVDDLENKDCANKQQLKKIRPDANLVHNDGFYLFNIQVHRVLILNNKSKIRRWLIIKV